MGKHFLNNRLVYIPFNNYRCLLPGLLLFCFFAFIEQWTADQSVGSHFNRATWTIEVAWHFIGKLSMQLQRKISNSIMAKVGYKIDMRTEITFYPLPITCFD